MDVRVNVRVRRWNPDVAAMMARKPKFLGDLLRQVREGKGLSLPSLAEKLGVDRNTLGAYEREERLPDLEFIGKFAEITGWDAGRLLKARVDASQFSPQLQEALRSIRRATDATALFARRRSTISDAAWSTIQTIASEKNLDADGLERELGGAFPVEALQLRQPTAPYAHIPLYDVRAAAGKGELVTTESPIDVLAFKEDWIRQALRRRPEDLRLIYVEGDSMEPDLRAGDIILVDHTDTQARREGIYVLLLDGALLVKTLQRLPGGVIRVISRNESYEPFSVKVDELDTPGAAIIIVGRVVWQCRGV